MKTKFIILTLLFSLATHAQVGINTIHPNATLDVVEKKMMEQLLKDLSYQG